jgi:hypothetical protein
MDWIRDTGEMRVDARINSRDDRGGLQGRARCVDSSARRVSQLQQGWAGPRACESVPVVGSITLG